MQDNPGNEEEEYLVIDALFKKKKRNQIEAW